LERHSQPFLICSLANFDPNSGRADPEVLEIDLFVCTRTPPEIYGTVVRSGRLATGQSVRLERLAEM
jgi:hypothetical protein